MFLQGSADGRGDNFVEEVEPRAINDASYNIVNLFTDLALHIYGVIGQQCL